MFSPIAKIIKEAKKGKRCVAIEGFGSHRGKRKAKQREGNSAKIGKNNGPWTSRELRQSNFRSNRQRSEWCDRPRRISSGNTVGDCRGRSKHPRGPLL